MSVPWGQECLISIDIIGNAKFYGTRSNTESSSDEQVLGRHTLLTMAMIIRMKHAGYVDDDNDDDDDEETSKQRTRRQTSSSCSKLLRLAKMKMPVFLH